MLANGCDGGWMVLAQPGDHRAWKELAGKKIAVQNGSIGLVSLNWKLKQEGMFGKVEMAFMDNQDQPVPLMRGDVGAICVFEPYAALAELNGWGKSCGCRTTRPWARPTWASWPREAFIKKDPGAHQEDGEGACEGDQGDGVRTARSPSRPRSSSSR